jgi:UDP-N-acetylglucosamine kinase
MKHDLTDSQLSSTFTTDIKPWLDARGHTVEAPTAHAIIGQPGSGTNALIDSTRRDDPTTLAVRRDDLRQFHPNYNDLLADSPQAMPAATLQAADQWQAMSLKHAAEQNYSVVWDSDTTNPNALNSQLAQFRQHGFDTSATAIAEPRELSLLSTV